MMASSLQQIAAVTEMNLRSIPSRLGASLVIVIGIAGVVGVMVALLSMARGFQATLGSTGRPDRVIMVRGGATDELSSVVMREQVLVVRQAAGIRQGADGKPLVLAEKYILAGIPRVGSTDPANVVVRGTEDTVLSVRPEARLVAGRMFKPGVYEVIIGRGVASQFANMRLGSRVPIRNGDWTVVGIFESGGDVHESEMWADLETLMAAAKSPVMASITAQLASADGFQAFKDLVTTDPRLSLSVQREPDYYASRSQALNDLVTVLGYTVAVIMGIGALFGALNTMYAAISTRAVEIATLRAIGFSGAPVVISVLLEALLLSLLGGVLGALVAYVVFNGYSVSTLNFQTFSQVAFDFKVTPDLLVQGVAWALFIGLLGGLFPAIRAARLPVAEALRAA
jgi:putative ABC transport system permease protein